MQVWNSWLCYPLKDRASGRTCFGRTRFERMCLERMCLERMAQHQSCINALAGSPGIKRGQKSGTKDHGCHSGRRALMRSMISGGGSSVWAG